VELTRFDDVTAFFAHAKAFLAERESHHNLLLGLRMRLERDPHTFGDVDPYLAVVERNREIVGVGFQSPPYNPVLSEIDDLEAVDLLVADLLEVRPLSGVGGPVEASARFASIWENETGGRASISMAQRIYEAAHAQRPAGVRGRPRDYEPRDRELVVSWMEAFAHEAMPTAPPQDAISLVDRRAADPDAAFVLWEDGGETVSLAGYGGPTPNGIRVGPVYTPPDLRGRGYGSAVTAEVTARMLDSGRRFCFLYTDLANPTSNSIYQRIGYRPVSDISQWDFTAA
jgi:uncharacterized protein